jgi:multidrug efflux pump subunit AcrB
MNLAEFSIKKSVITWTLTVVTLVLGYFSYQNLARLEDPEFAIKEAVVITPYPGASAREVEQEVTELIEKAAQELGQLKRVQSYSERGLSKVRVVIKDSYDKDALPQVWDELRRKVNDYQAQLPPGAGPSRVNDDFGDVFGVYFALVGDGYTFAELKDVGELLKRELLTVPDVKKVIFFGEQKENIFIEMSRARMAALGITRQEIFDALRAKNLPEDAGRMKMGPEHVAISPGGLFTSEVQFGDLLVASKSGRLIYLKDVATIRRGYEDPPSTLLRFNGRPALGLAISTAAGGNVVTMGDGVKARLAQLAAQVPVGMDLEVISLQSDTVTESINGFVVNLGEAVAIVVLVLLLAMGLRSGLIIGFILLLTIAATFLVMDYYAITLERISLGALIIALGMLVDNAIVIVDGMKVKMEQGVDGLTAARDVVGQNSIPLLGATAVAVLAFASIGGMDNSTGEYCRSLYYVILISLSLSWLTGVTATPLITSIFVLPKKKAGASGVNSVETDPYGGKLFQAYRLLLDTAIRRRWLTLSAVGLLFVAAMVGFGYLDNLFFPPSTRPQFLVEVQFKEGTHIRDTEAGVAQMEAYLHDREGVTDIASAIGAGHVRFLLTYSVPVDASRHYAAILVSVKEYAVINRILGLVQDDLDRMFPDATVNVKRFGLGPGEGGKIQLRINGPDPVVLRALAERAKEIIRSDPDTKAVRDEWGPKVKVIRPVLADARARRLGISRTMIAQELHANFTGTVTGLYREGIDLIPIVARAPKAERTTVENMRDLQIYSPTAGRMVPMAQVVDGLETVFEDARLSRWHRETMIKLHADARTGLPSTVMERIKPKVEQALGADVGQYFRRGGSPDDYDWSQHTATTIPVKYDDKIPLAGLPGYFMAWSGELEDSADAIAKLAASIPIYFGMMIIVIILLFNAFKQPAIIWLTVPLAMIGVSAGLLLLKQPFGFMALLGVMSLSGMLIKNAIVLIDQIDLEIREGKERYQAVVDSGVSRMRPVMLAAATTILGMVPLLQDDFFIAMAVAIMFGLLGATILTLVFVPVLYAIFFRIPSPSDA